MPSGVKKKPVPVWAPRMSQELQVPVTPQDYIWEVARRVKESTS